MGMRQLPIVGVNLGRLGFLADLSPAEFRQQFPKLQSRDYRIIEHLMFQCTVKAAGHPVETFLGLNEVVVSSGGSMHMVDVHLAIDGQSVTTYSCDGLIVALAHEKLADLIGHVDQLVRRHRRPLLLQCGGDG